MYIFGKKRNWAYDIRQKFHASYVTVSLSDIRITFTAYFMKPENIYKKENDQKTRYLYIVLLEIVKLIFIKYLIYFFVLLDICIAWKICTFWAYSFLILKSTLVSSKTTLIGNLHYREKGEQTDSTRDID